MNSNNSSEVTSWQSSLSFLIRLRSSSLPNISFMSRLSLRPSMDVVGASRSGPGLTICRVLSMSSLAMLRLFLVLGCHVLVEIGQLLDLLLDRRAAVRVLGHVELVDVCLQAMKLVEGRLYLLAPELLWLCLLRTLTHYYLYCMTHISSNHEIIQLKGHQTGPLIMMSLLPKPFSSFRQIINEQGLTQYTSRQEPDGQLQIHSRMAEEALQLGLQSDRSDMDGEVKSSIDGQSHKMQAHNGSIPLSQLILRDNGYDYMFSSRQECTKMIKKMRKNIRQLQEQTEEMISLVKLSILSQQEQETKVKIKQVQKQLSQLKIARQSRSPIQPQKSQYLCEPGRKGRQRLSGRLRRQPCKDSKSNLKTQCDSKTTTFPSAPITPVSLNKVSLGSPRQVTKQRTAMLRRKVALLKESICTTETFYKQRIAQAKEENTILQQELSMFGSRLNVTPLRGSNFATMSRQWERMASGSKSPGKRIFGLVSPRRIRQSKVKESRKMVSLRRGGSPRDEYFSTGPRKMNFNF